MDDEIKDTHYFVAFHGFNSDGNLISYGNRILPLGPDSEEFEKDLIGSCLEVAKEHNSNVTDVFVLSFNRV